MKVGKWFLLAFLSIVFWTGIYFEYKPDEEMIERHDPSLDSILTVYGKEVNGTRGVTTIYRVRRIDLRDVPDYLGGYKKADKPPDRIHTVYLSPGPSDFDKIERRGEGWSRGSGSIMLVTPQEGRLTGWSDNEYSVKCYDTALYYSVSKWNGIIEEYTFLIVVNKEFPTHMFSSTFPEGVTDYNILSEFIVAHPPIWSYTYTGKDDEAHYIEKQKIKKAKGIVRRYNESERQKLEHEQ